MESHWLPGVERRGLGNLVLSVNHIALIVADVGRSLTFYTDVLGLQQIQRPNFDRFGAWLTAGNIELHLIKGHPLVHSGDNLIVSHIALDVADPAEAFRRLASLQVPFEVNISVPKGQGKAASEGGSRDNTLSQAFLRDPDGYYIEICNCNLLTDFAMGRISGLVDGEGMETCSTDQTRRGYFSFYWLVRMVVLAHRARAACKRRKQAGRCSVVRTGTHTLLGKDDAVVQLEGEEDGSTKINEEIYENLLSRQLIYGDVCQSFASYELRALLGLTNNSAPEALKFMLDEIYQGHRKRMFQPPSYYFEGRRSNLQGGDDDDDDNEPYKYSPKPFAAPRRRSSNLVTTAAGMRWMNGKEEFQLAKRRSTKVHMGDSFSRLLQSLVELEEDEED